MTLCDRFVWTLRENWSLVFAQRRSLGRAVEHALATLCCFGRRTVSRTVCAVGRHRQDWSADYKLYSRSPWQAARLFAPVLKAYLRRFPEGPVAIGFDDTKTPKTGKKIATAFWQRDPLSPPFHTNLLWGLRFLQASALFPLHREGDHDARGLPVRFVEAPALKKPGSRATAEQRQAHREAKRMFNLSTLALATIRDLRAELDAIGGRDRRMLAVLDGSFCNRTVFGTPIDRVDLIARCRKDASLCLPAAPGTRRKYSAEKFTPEQVHTNSAVPWQIAHIYFAGAKRDIQYKPVAPVLWQRGARTRPLRLFVIAPQPYKLSPNSRTNLRQPAYLLTADLDTPADVLIQAYFDRWQIEVNHRDEKQIIGVGQAQVHAQASVPRHPAFLVAAYSLLLLAALEQFGPSRTDDYVPLPKWRRHARRPSALDLITLLRKEINERHSSPPLGENFSENLNRYAYT